MKKRYFVLFCFRIMPPDGMMKGVSLYRDVVFFQCNLDNV